jgi:ATP-binding cassette subfamily C (CFTR/MRP) protein 1
MKDAVDSPATPRAPAPAHGSSAMAADDAPGSKELEAPDALAAAVQPEPTSDEDDKVERARDGDGEGEDGNGEKYNRLAATRSCATDASGATAATTAPKPKPRKWYSRVNPLRWGGIPGVPAERIVSREYEASFLSKLTFQWMTPLMTVSLLYRAASMDGS